MSLLITILIKPISYNAYYRNSRSGNRIKTGAGLAYDEELELLLSEFREELEEFGHKLDPSKNIATLEISFANPDFFIKDGSRISKTAGDLDNTIKVLQDKIFSFVQVDDYICRDVRAFDFPSNSWEVYIRLNIKAIPDFRHVQSLSILDELKPFDFDPSPSRIVSLESLDFP